uniref:UBC core domain-containing protein n=1 Tax=Panagrellus redivivus TaxID=6233 RepID=A0A7E4V384_PANRE
MSVTRLMLELKQLQEYESFGVSAYPKNGDLMKWEAQIVGPENSPFDLGVFKLSVKFTNDYPKKPPTVTFITRMFHPNIYYSGVICLDILNKSWSPHYNIATILLCLQGLLGDPNPKSPANYNAANLFQWNYPAYVTEVRKHIQINAERVEEESADEKPRGLILKSLFNVV